MKSSQPFGHGAITSAACGRQGANDRGQVDRRPDYPAPVIRDAEAGTDADARGMPPARRSLDFDLAM